MKNTRTDRKNDRLNFSYILIFSVFCAGLLFSGCSNGSSDDDEDYSGLTQATITGRSYIPSGLTGSFGARLATQIADKTSTYDSACVNYFVTDDLLKNDTSLTNFKLLVKHLLSGKTVIFVEPTYKALQAVDLGLAIIAGYTTEEFKKMLPELSSFSNDAFSIIRQVSDSTDSFFSASVTDKGEIPVYDALAIRGPQIRYIENIKQSVKELNEANPDSTAIEVNDSLYNLFLPDFVSWLNEYENSRAVRDALYTRGTHKIEGLNVSGDFITSATEVEKSFLAISPHTANSSDCEKMAVNIITYYWSFSKEIDSGKRTDDYLLFVQKITYNNKDLNCNTDADTKCWYDRYGYESIYGPYFSSASIKNSLYSEKGTYLFGIKSYQKETPAVYNVSPLSSNNITTYTEGTNYSLSVSFSGKCSSKEDQAVGVTGSIKFTSSRNTERKNISTMYSEDDGDVSWTWTGKVPDFTENSIFSSNTHTQAVEELRTNIDLSPSWRWEINDSANKKSYLLHTEASVITELLSYYGKRYYNTASAAFNIPVLAPTRYSNIINLYVDWDGRKTDTEGKIYSFDQTMGNRVKLYYPSYNITTRTGKETDVDLQVLLLSEQLKEAITSKKGALIDDGITKQKYTFTFVDQNDRIIKDAGFTIDFSN